MADFSLYGAFLVGLMGAGHCVGMCGGLLGALSGQIPINVHKNRLVQILQYQLSYQVGRIFSYVIAGAICGALANGLNLLFSFDFYLIGLRIIAGIMMILTGLYIAQIWTALLKIEQLGKHFWLKIQPISRRFLPLRHPTQAIVIGGIWGWLPCGLVYSMLTWSVASGNPVNGSLIMLCFGAGTLPVLLFTGIAAKNLALWLKHKAVKLISGLALVGFGIQTIYVAVLQLN